MKLHLPLTLLRSLQESLKGIARTTIGLGTLLLLPSGSTFLWLTTAAHLEEQEASELKKELPAEAAEHLWQNALDNWELQHDPSRTLANATLTAMTATHMGYISGSGSITPPDVVARNRHSASVFYRPDALITAGTLPLQNYVARGSAPKGSTTAAATAAPAAITPPAPAPLAADPADTPPRRRTTTMLRSFARSATLLAASVDDSPITSGTLIWSGSASEAWDTSSRNWTLSGAATTYSNGSSVAFTESGRTTDINVTAARTVSDMTVSGAGYTFSGGGDITVSNELYIAASGDTTFVSGTDVSATTVTLKSAHGTTTTFSGSLTASSLTMSNSTSVADAGNYAGSYVFNGNVSVSGAASANLGTADTHANLDQALTVNGTFSASSLTLAGASMKHFAGNVTTSGNLSISATEEDIRNGLTTFLGTVSVGGSLTLKDNATVTIGNEGELTVTGSFYMGDATLNYTRFTNASVHDFGTITLISNGAELGLDSLSRGEGTISSQGDTAYNFTFINSTREFAATLDNLSDLSVKGGNITIKTGSSGELSGSLAVSGGASLLLEADDVFTSTATGNISVSSATLNLGSTEQDVNGTITLNQGYITGDAGALLTATGNTSLIYTNANNSFSTTLATGSTALAITATPAEDSTTSPQLTIDGDITGSGTLTFSGSGTTNIESALSYTGAVTIGAGSTLVLDDSLSLSAASSLTVGNGGSLSVTHDGATTSLNGTGGLLLQSGAEINFSDLSGHDNVPALALTGELLFGGDIKFTFHENRTDENGEQVKLVNLHTYELITSATGINRVTGTSAGSDVVYANGKDTPLDSSQYEFGFYSEKFYDETTGKLVEEIRHLTFTLLAGKSWNGGESGEWHDKTGDSYTNWTEGVVGDAALFREQLTTADDDNLLTDANGNAVLTDTGKNVMKDVAITMKTSSGATDLYMDGRTNYTITGVESLKDAATRAFTADATIIKKGSGTMTWNGVALNLEGTDIQEGTLLVAEGSTLTASGTINVADVSYNSAGERVTSATLAIESGSLFKQGSATIQANAATTNATLHGVSISGGTISGADYATQTITNARVDGFTVDNTTFSGTGTLSNLTVHEGVTIGSDATYELGSNMAILSQVTNAGTIKVTSSSLIGVGRLGEEHYSVSDDGTTTYTPFVGGSYEGWQSLTKANFRVRGTNLDLINDIDIDVTTSGQLKVSSTKVRFIRWDTTFNEDSWLTPTVGLMNTPSSTGDDFTIVSGTNSDYQYSKRVSGGSANTYVANILSGGGNAGNTLIGGGTAIASASSSEAPIHIWTNDEGSIFGKYIGGVGLYNTAGGTWYGDSHLQLQGSSTNNTNVYGGSQNTIQIGNSYLTIYSGNYANAAGGNLRHNDIGEANSYLKGSSNLHLVGGSFSNVYGGSYNTYTEGNTRVIVDGGTITTLYGGDYSTLSSSTHTGNVTVELQGGNITNLYAAGGGSNAGTVNGNVTVNFHADEDGNMLAKFADPTTTTSTSGWGFNQTTTTTTTYSQLNGGNGSVNSGYTSTLAFVDAGTYDLAHVNINNFDVISLVQGANVTATVQRFNSSNNLTISGPGTVTLSGETKTSDITLTNGATLLPRVKTWSDYTANPTLAPNIYVAAGSMVDVTGRPSHDDNDLEVHLHLAGDGTAGQGALYKDDSATDNRESNKVSMAYITLTDNASVGAEGNSAIYMIALKVTDFKTTLDLTNSDENKRGYTFTKLGSGTFGFKNTNVLGGTLNVVEGTLEASHSSMAQNADLVLHSGGTLSFTADIGTPPSDATDKSHNGFAVETLSGTGTVNLGTVGWLYLSMNQGYSDFSEDFSTTARSGQLYYNEEHYEYAHFKGLLTGSGIVSKTGSGTQYFCGSESDFSGRTYVLDGVLYLMGTSTATDFARAEVGTDEKLAATTTVTKGAVGEGDIYWQGGDVFLGDGVTIYNGSTDSTLNTGSISIGVDAVKQEDDSLYYNDATWSGVLISTSGMDKKGLGTLTVDQRGSFAGGTQILGGTLNLTGWASANDATISMTSGSSLMFSYDGSYAGESSTETVGSATTLLLTGTGDVRWLTDGKTGEEKETAALISDIASGKTLQITGLITDGSASGNVLHSGEGTLVLSGANTYTGGSTISHGQVTVSHNTGLGATATAPTANLVTYAGSSLLFSNGVSTTLAAYEHEADSLSYGGNNIRGTVILGVAPASTESTMEATTLTMSGDGYYAARTELEANSTLIFSGAYASNWDGEANTSDKAEMGGAGTLAGNGTVLVTNAEAYYNADADKNIEGTTVYFQVTDTLHSGESGFAGDLTVRGDNTTLHIQSGEINGGDYTVSGNGTRLDAKRSSITVNEGQTVALSSMGDAYREAGSTAVLAAHSVVVELGGHLLASKEAAFAENEETQVDVSYALGSYRTDSYAYHFSTGTVKTTYDKYFASNKTEDENRQTVAQLDTVGGLTMNAGSIYELYDTNISLTGTQLTFNVTDDAKIVLRGNTVLQNYIQSLIDADAQEAAYREQGLDTVVATGQYILFSDVGSFNAILNGENLTEGATALEYREMQNQIYVMLARDFLRTDCMQTDAQLMLASDDATTTTTETTLDPLATATNILLVYDAGARVVYLDRNPNVYEELEEEDYHPIVLPEAAVPEPTTATLSLLALTALAARRRRSSADSAAHAGASRE